MDQVSPTIIKILLNYATTIGVNNPNYVIEPASEKGDNFMSIISKLKVEDLDTKKVLSVIIKRASSDEHTRAVMHTHAMFGREVWTYKKLIPILNDLRVITACDKLQFPFCIEAYDKDKVEWLALEDMCLKGYKLHRPRLASLDEQHMEIALAALAEFHALSFVLKDKNVSLFNSLVKEIPDTLFPANSNSETFEPYLKQAVERALKVITNQENRDKLMKLCNNLYEKNVEIVKPNNYAVFCHGDYWKNNIMFKYKDGVPISVCAFDYQIVRASSPLLDILYLIFCCSTQQERSTHYEGYLRHYYTKLCKQLAGYNIEPNFSWSDFLVEATRCSPFAITLVMMVLPLLTCSSHNIPDASDVVDGGLCIEDSESLELFSDRLNGVVEDCISYGYI